MWTVCFPLSRQRSLRTRAISLPPSLPQVNDNGLNTVLNCANILQRKLHIDFSDNPESEIDRPIRTSSSPGFEPGTCVIRGTDADYTTEAIKPGDKRLNLISIIGLRRSFYVGKPIAVGQWKLPFLFAIQNWNTAFSFLFQFLKYY